MLWAIEVTRMGTHEVVTSAEDSVVLLELIILFTVLLYEPIDKIEFLLQLRHFELILNSLLSQAFILSTQLLLQGV